MSMTDTQENPPPSSDTEDDSQPPEEEGTPEPAQEGQPAAPRPAGDSPEAKAPGTEDSEDDKESAAKTYSSKDYAVSVPEDLKDSVTLAPDDELLSKAVEVAAKAGIPPEHLQSLAEVVLRQGAQSQAAEHKEVAKYLQDRFDSPEAGQKHLGKLEAFYTKRFHDNDDVKSLIEKLSFSPAGLQFLESFYDERTKADPPSRKDTPASAPLTEASLRKIQAEPDYWDDPDKQRRVKEGYERLAAKA